MDWEKWGMFGAVAGAMTVLIAKLMAMMSIPVLKLTMSATEYNFNVREHLTGGIDTGIGAKIFSYLSGTFNFGQFEIWILAALTGAVIAVIGRYLWEFVKVGRTFETKTATIFVLGSAVAGFVLSYLAKTATPTIDINYFVSLITLGIYFLIVSWVTVKAYKSMGWSIPN